MPTGTFGTHRGAAPTSWWARLVIRMACGRAIVGAACALTSWAVCAAPGVAPSQPPPAARPAGALPDGARELVALPGGAWLALTRRELQMVDASGAVRARWPVRGESLDARADASGGGFAVVVDSNAERVVPVRFDLASGALEALPALPQDEPSIGATCIYRDEQGHHHVFVLASNGLAHQWAIRSSGQALAVRRFAVAPEPEHCRVDDRHSRLFVSDAGGVWAHPAHAEGPDAREVVALVRPHGSLQKGGGALAVWPGGVAVLDGARLVTFSLKSRIWHRVATAPLPAGSDPRAVALAGGPSTGRLQLLAYDDGRAAWHGLPVSMRANVGAEDPRLPVVRPRVQTTPVLQFGDAADDPAIWVHPNDAAASLVLGTDKKRGLAVYDLQGRERQFLAVGRLNNVDLRQDVRLGDERLDIAAASHRDALAVVLFRIGPDRQVTELARVPVGYKDIYGLCMRRTPAGEAEVFVNDKDGRTMQLRIERDSQGAVVGRRLREFRLDSQPEGCVVDDGASRLFAGEERRGVWTMSAEPDNMLATDRRMILPVGPLLRADVEGLAVHREGSKAYLVVSSQGNDSYVVLDATAPFQMRGAFRIGMDMEAGIDGVSETDGLDVTAMPLGPAFPKGLLVVQDGRKRMPEGPQNYKYVSWEDVVRVLSLP